MLSLIWFLRCMSEFWCQSLSNWASLDPAAGRSGWWEESGIFGTWVTFQHIHSLHALSLVVFFLLVSFHPPSPWQKRKKKKQLHAWPAEGLNRSETLLSNSHQPCVNPQGDRENSKHRFPAKTKKRTAVRPLSAACLLCKGPTGCQSRRSMPG